MVQKLSVQIQLEGAEEIQRQLAGVSKAGQQCFADIQQAAEKAGGFAKLDPSVIEQTFKRLGVTATGEIAKINAALKSSTDLEATVLGVSKLEQGFKKTGAAATAAFGLTRRELGALSKALREVDLGPLGSQLSLIGRVGAAFGPVGIAVTAVAVALTGGIAALIKFAADASETAKQVDNLAGVSGRSFERVSSLVTAFSMAGASAKTFTGEMAGLVVKMEEARKQASAEFWGPATEEQIKLANSIGSVAQQWQNVAAGGKAAFNSLTTTETKVKSLQKFLSDAAKRGEDFELVLADVVKNMTPLERAQILPGLGLSPETIEALKQGRVAIEQMRQEAGSLGLTLTTANQQALLQMAQAWNQFTGLLSAFFQKIGAMAAPAFAQLLGGFKQVMVNIVTDFQNLPLDQAIANLGNRLAPAFAALGELLSPLLSQIGNALGAALVSGIIAAVKARFSGDAGTMGPLQPGAAGFEQRAGGGLLGGRGTGTSDSNLAWVSRGEHIMPAAAVAQPGVLAFLEALRRSGGNLAGVLNGMGRFALGGMVPRAMPAFAGGGLAAGMSNVTIAFPGLPPIGGLRASSAVVDELRKSAALAQVRSGGRKPSRYS
jgi:predicted Zn-dependent protease with MMP-like domain